MTYSSMAAATPRIHVRHSTSPAGGCAVRRRKRGNQVLLAAAAAWRADATRARGQAASSRARHRWARRAHGARSAASDTCFAAPSSHGWERASSSSMPVRAALRGPLAGRPRTRPQMASSCSNTGCSGHSSSSSLNRLRTASTGAWGREQGVGKVRAEHCECATVFRGVVWRASGSLR
jgi:hypothetical protein